MNLSDIQLMYEYNNWANHVILAKSAEVTPEQFVAPTTHSFGSLRGTIVHTLDAEWSWRVRLQANEDVEELKPEDFPTIESVRQRWQEEEAAWGAYLGGLSDADMPRIISYAIPGGTRERVLWHCLYHVVNHGMQHRSEAAHMLTQYEQSPGGLDFTLFLNTRTG
ncbi:MAG: DinB family protein [Chloroflexota bacterium]